MLTEKESKAIIVVSGAKKASKKFGEKCKASKNERFISSKKKET